MLKNNLWTLLFLGMFMSIVIGRYMINNDGFSNLKIIYDHIVNNENKNTSQNFIINDWADKMISQLFTGNVTNLINEYNEKHNVTKGVIYTAFNVITKGQQQLQNTFNAIMHYENRHIIKSIVVIVASTVGILIRIFVVYPIRVSETRIYLESINYKKTRIKRLTYAFKKERYLGAVKAMLLMEIKKFLWNLTIVGGIIKNYSYKMVTYVIAENPSITAKEAIKISEEMMNGNKFQVFKLDVSFLGWCILQYITFGILKLYSNLHLLHIQYVLFYHYGILNGHLDEFKDCSLLLSKSEFISDIKPSAPTKIIGPTNNAVGLILLK